MFFIFFFYGLAFFSLGLSILIFPKKDSEIRLAKELLFLAGFGIIHGINEWIDMSIYIIKPEMAYVVKLIGLAALAISYMFLLEFGFVVISRIKNRYFALKFLPLLLFISWLVIALFSRQNLLNGNIWARYILGVPGAFLCGYAFFLEYNRLNKINLGGGVWNLKLAALAFFFYGLLSGLIVPQAGFFPASFLNYSVFLNITGIPVQVFRCICAVVIAYSLIRALSLFEYKTKSRIKQLLEATQEAEKRYETLAETSPDCIKLFDLKRNLFYINKGGLDEHRLKDLEEAKKWIIENGIIAEDREKFRRAFQDAVLGKTSTIEIRHTAEDSTREACLETMVPVKNAKGRVVNVFGVSRDISEIKKLEEIKDSLVHMIVHDLRNPLSIAFHGIEFLQDDIKDKLSSDGKKALSISLERLDEIKNMISNILDINKMEEGKFILNYEATDIAILINEIVNEMKILSERKKIKVEMPVDLSMLNCDRLIIKRVISNLAVNALKFTPEGDKIEISAIEDNTGKYLVISVKDYGEGIPVEYREKVFDKFIQAHDKEARAIGGKGLGLAFCKMAVEAHGGRIWVDSEIGRGSVFSFSIPKDLDSNLHI